MAGYPTPDEAARSTAPDEWPADALPSVQEWAFVVGSSIAPDGQRALVILGEGRDPEPALGPIALVVQAPAGATAEGWVFFAAWGHPYVEDEMAADWYARLKPAPTVVDFE